jgi:hypothetical protein
MERTGNLLTKAASQEKPLVSIGYSSWQRSLLSSARFFRKPRALQRGCQLSPAGGAKSYVVTDAADKASTHGRSNP